MMSSRTSVLVLLLVSLGAFATGCDNNPTSPDGGTDAGGDLPDGEVADAQPRDAQMGDAQRPDGGTVGVRECAAASAPPLASGICAATAGDGNLLITADILLPDEVLAGGQVLIDASGTIVCADCDCSAAAGAATATRLDCPDGVVSPGLINVHEHVTFQGIPAADTGERFEQRHDWRRGQRGHNRVRSTMATSEQMRWAELRMVMSGATAINGSGGQDGFLRNLDRANMEGLGQAQVEYDTFPLDDASGLQLATGCMYGAGATTATQIAGEDAYTPHVSEGIDSVARNEFLCLSMGATDLIQPNTAMIHGIALLPQDMDVVSTDGAMLIWSPRSNIALYGETAHVREYDVMGVPIAIGTDWIFSGSMNMTRELQCADELNADYFDGHFSDADLWRMATINGATATATDDVIGAITVGRVADIAIFDGSVHPLHRAVIDAEPQDIALVLRGGVPLYGESAIVPLLRDGGACDELDVCGATRRACVTRELGVTFAELEASVAGSYPLFFCDGATPTNEPSCHPSRPASVAGSTIYDGLTTADDADGDSVATADDNCPNVFNPIRPMDMGAQADFDADMVGDACDPCPLEAGATDCAPSDPNDRDRDMVTDSTDNCPGVANTDQADADADGKGDACDACPMAANPGAAGCPATIYDVKDGTVVIGSRVVVSGVVTALATTGFFAQVPTGSTDYVGPDNSGVFVFTGTAPTAARGDVVSIDGMPVLFPTTGMSEIQFSRPTVTVTGTAAVPAPIVVTPTEIATGGARAAALEAVLVRVEAVTVSNIMPAPAGGETAPTNEFLLTGGLLVDDALFLIDPFPVMSESFTSITGVLQLRRDNSKLLPRDGADVVAGTSRLVALEPALSYARVGAGSVPTFPTALTVRLSRAVAADTVVTLMSSTGATVGNVTVLMGTASAVVPVEGMTASATPVTITATLGVDVSMAMVRVLGATELPTSFTLSPTDATVRIGTSATFTVTSDIPAPPGGATIALADTTGGTLPASVVIPENATTATFDFTAGTTATTGTLTATAFSVMRTAALTVSAGVPGTIVINEIDYDQTATDNAEFVELHNPGISAFDLTNLALVFVNGSGNTEYMRVALTGSLAAGEYLIVGVAGQTLVLPTGVRRIDLASTATMQNGAPDGVAIIRTTDGALLDALCYEGAMPVVTITGRTYSLVEGTALDAGIADPGTGAGSLARSPNGADTNDASVDWALTTRPTPGASNDEM